MSDRTRMIAPFKDLEEDLRLVDESLRQILLTRRIRLRVLAYGVG